MYTTKCDGRHHNQNNTPSNVTAQIKEHQVDKNTQGGKFFDQPINLTLKVLTIWFYVKMFNNKCNDFFGFNNLEKLIFMA